jgi:hypothetical protein
MLPIAAARLSEGIAEEEQLLMSLVTTMTTDIKQITVG